MKCQNCGEKEGVWGKFRTKDGLFTRQMCLCEECEKQFESVSFKGRVKRHKYKILALLGFIAIILLWLFLVWWNAIHQPPKVL